MANDSSSSKPAKTKLTRHQALLTLPYQLENDGSPMNQYLRRWLEQEVARGTPIEALQQGYRAEASRWVSENLFDGAPPTSEELAQLKDKRRNYVVRTSGEKMPAEMVGELNAYNPLAREEEALNRLAGGVTPKVDVSMPAEEITAEAPKPKAKAKPKPQGAPKLPKADRTGDQTKDLAGAAFNLLSQIGTRAPMLREDEDNMQPPADVMRLPVRK